jgi:hypothetical protein
MMELKDNPQSGKDIYNVYKKQKGSYSGYVMNTCPLNIKRRQFS